MNWKQTEKGRAHMRAYWKAYRARNKVRYNEYHRKYQQSDKGKASRIRLRTLRERTKKRPVLATCDCGNQFIQKPSIKKSCSPRCAYLQCLATARLRKRARRHIRDWIIGSCKICANWFIKDKNCGTCSIECRTENRSRAQAENQLKHKHDAKPEDVLQRRKAKRAEWFQRIKNGPIYEGMAERRRLRVASLNEKYVRGLLSHGSALGPKDFPPEF